MFRVLQWLFHFVLETIAMINPISQVAKIFLIAMIVGVSGNDGQALELVLKR